MVISNEINKIFKEVLTPVLKKNGFTKTEARKSFGWHDECIWLFKIEAVGYYFSEVTGWPSMSVHASIGVFCKFFKSNKDIKVDKSGLLLPKLDQCHYTFDLSCRLDQRNYKSVLANPNESIRKDIWWIEPDGNNVYEVTEDIKRAFLSEGVIFLKGKSNKQDILKEEEDREKLLYEIENKFAKGYGK